MVGLALSHVAPQIQLINNQNRCSCSKNTKKLIEARALEEVGEVLDRFAWLAPARAQPRDFLDSLLAKILVNHLRAPKTVNKNLASMTAHTGSMMGASFALCLASSTSPETAVAEFIAKYPALQELTEMHSWFRPMLESVAQGLLAQAAWGAKLRLYIGAGVSMLDAVSDVNMIVVYMAKAETSGYGEGLLWMLGLCVFFQLLQVMSANWRAPWYIKVREVLYVVTFIKPGVDSHRVASGQKQEVYSNNSPRNEHSKHRASVTALSPRQVNQ
jgi:hypothetical protein